MMKKILSCFLCGAFLFSCNNNKTETAATATPGEDSTVKTATVDLPYKPSYTSDFSTDVPDSSLKLVLQSYKDWADGNMANVAKAYGDSLGWDRPSGEYVKLPNAGLMKLWGTYRDSLSSITIDMQAWHKMRSGDKKDSWIAAWYKETDTYKSGKADSGYYHDLNLLKDGKIVYLEQYKRAAK